MSQDQRVLEQVPRFTRSTLPDAVNYQDVLIIIVEPDDSRGLWRSNGASWIKLNEDVLGAPYAVSFLAGATTIALQASPGLALNLNVVMGGVVQRKLGSVDYTWNPLNPLVVTLTSPAADDGEVFFTAALPIGTIGSNLVSFLQAGFGAIPRMLEGKNRETVSVTDFMTDAQRADIISGAAPTLASSAAIKVAWDAMKARGGTLVIPPGNYLADSQIVFDVTTPTNIEVKGFGATLYATAAVTSSHLKVTGSYNHFGLDIKGLTFNHRNNTTVQGCIEVRGGHNVKIKRCTAELHNTKAGWYFAKLASSASGASEDDYNSFWCSVQECNTRQRSGGDGADGAYGILCEGAVNAFSATGNIFTSVVKGIEFVPGPTSTTLANAVVIERNAFEGVSGVAISCLGAPGIGGPTGWIINSNRVETTPTFFSITTGGAGMSVVSQPPFLFGNYCTTGSVTNWIVNPTNAPLSVLEMRTPNFGPVVENNMNMAGGMKMTFSLGGGLTLVNTSDSANYLDGWLKQGSYRYWTNHSDGKFYVKGSVPANNTDGQVVGTQA